MPDPQYEILLKKRQRILPYSNDKDKDKDKYKYKYKYKDKDKKKTQEVLRTMC